MTGRSMGRKEWAGFGAGLLVLMLLPFLLNDRHQNTVITCLLYIFLGSAWNLIGGLGKQISFGHAAFFGVGAYTSTILMLETGVSPWIGMIAGGGVAATAAILLGVLCFRFRLGGVYFSMATIVLGEIFRILALNAEFLRKYSDVAGGLGITIPFRNDPWNYQFAGNLPYYFIILALAAMAILIGAAIRGSRLGYSLRALGDSDDSAAALGIHPGKVKIAALALSAFLVALAGTFQFQFIRYLDPNQSFSLHLSIIMVFVCLIGGLGETFGVVMGAIFIVAVREIITSLTSLMGGMNAGAVSEVVYGASLIAVVYFFPNGIFNYARRKINRAERMRVKAAETC